MVPLTRNRVGWVAWFKRHSAAAELTVCAQQARHDEGNLKFEVSESEDHTFRIDERWTSKRTMFKCVLSSAAPPEAWFHCSPQKGARLLLFCRAFLCLSVNPGLIP